MKHKIVKQRLNDWASQFKLLLRRLQRSIGFRLCVAMLILGSQLAIAAVVLRQIRNDVRDSKLRDIWAIFFLEMEKQARDLATELRLSGGGAQPDAKMGVFSYDSKRRLHHLSGFKWPFESLQDFGIQSSAEIKSWNLVYYGSAHFMMTKLKTASSQEALAIKPYNKPLTLSANHSAIDKTKVYVATRQAKLIFSNTLEIDADNFWERRLVQYFIQTPLWQGQVEFDSNLLGGYYGFFTEVPGTNLILFAETDKDVVSVPVRELVQNLAFQMGVSVFVVLILIQGILFLLLRPVRSMVENAKKIAEGNFEIQQSSMGFGELHDLSLTFQNMAQSLIARDRSIFELMNEKVENVRLSGELKVAKEIQKSFLPKKTPPSSSGLMIEATYSPATEVAGDWYNYVYDSKSGNTLLSIIDVSGHGTGASMYTAIAAALFDQFSEKVFQGEANIEDFFAAFDRAIKNFGEGRWSASGQIYFFERAQSELKIINAGHPPPVLCVKNGSAMRIKMPSPLLGLRKVEESFAVKRLAFQGGDFLLGYTDGLSERSNQAGTKLGIRAIEKTLTTLKHASPAQLIAGVKTMSDQFSQGKNADDDICMIAMRAV